MLALAPGHVLSAVLMACTTPYLARQVRPGPEEERVKENDIDDVNSINSHSIKRTND